MHNISHVLKLFLFSKSINELKTKNFFTKDYIDKNKFKGYYNKILSIIKGKYENK